MGVLVIFDGAGPLPQSTTFNSPIDGPATFFISGTAWTQTAGNTIGFNFSLDGNAIGSCMCYANQSASHMTMRPTFIEVDNLTFGEHTIELDAAYGFTVTDQNDFFQVVLLY